MQIAPLIFDTWMDGLDCMREWTQEPLWQTCPRGPWHQTTDMCFKTCSCLSACAPAPSQTHHSTRTVSAALFSLGTERREADWDSQNRNHPSWLVWDILICDNVWFLDMINPPFEYCVKGNCKVNRVIHAAVKVLSSLLHRPADPYFLTSSRH